MSEDRLGVEASRKAMLESVPEETLLQQIRLLADITNWETYHTRDSRGSDAGFPDLVLVRPPRVLFVEVKKQGALLRTDQHLWQIALRQCPGVETYVWRPADWDEVERVLGPDKPGAPTS